MKNEQGPTSAAGQKQLSAEDKFRAKRKAEIAAQKRKPHIELKDVKQKTFAELKYDESKADKPLVPEEKKFFGLF